MERTCTTPTGIGLGGALVLWRDELMIAFFFFFFFWGGGLCPVRGTGALDGLFLAP